MEFDLSEFDQDDIMAALEVFKYGEADDIYPAWGMSDPTKALTYTAENIFSGVGEYCLTASTLICYFFNLI